MACYRPCFFGGQDESVNYVSKWNLHDSLNGLLNFIVEHALDHLLLGIINGCYRDMLKWPRRFRYMLVYCTFLLVLMALAVAYMWKQIASNYCIYNNAKACHNKIHFDKARGAELMGFLGPKLETWLYRWTGTRGAPFQ